MFSLPAEVVPVAEARAGLSRTLESFRREADAEPVVIGSHRRPEAVLMPFARYRDLTESRAGVSLQRLRTLASIIERLAAAAHLSNVKVYGSVARDEQTRESDLDLLVTPDDVATLYDIAQFEIDMETLLGIPVSIVSSGALDSTTDGNILSGAIAL